MINETKHTPGPWRIRHYELTRENLIAGPKGQEIAFLKHMDKDAETEGNAHLIAESPTMLEELEFIFDSFGVGRTITFSDVDIDRIGGVISRAKGNG